MPALLTRYLADGVVSPVQIISSTEAARHRERMERAEQELGPLHYIDKVHTVLTSPYELATHPVVLDTVEQLLGPDILLYNSTYIVKEPNSPAQVRWHQDLTYWGLQDDDAQVSMWLALAPATPESGCMQMIPGSHRYGRRPHDTSSGDDNLLLLGQHIPEVDSGQARYFPLEPGQASFHHGWTVHASMPNVSADRRIGLNVQYVSPHNFLKSVDGARADLVRGTDRFGHFTADSGATTDCEPEAVAAWQQADAVMKANFKIGG